MLPRIRKAKSGGALSHRITVSPKVLLLSEEGFASEEKRLDVHTFLIHRSLLNLLVHSSPIDARLLPVAAKQRPEPQHPPCSNQRTR